MKGRPDYEDGSERVRVRHTEGVQNVGVSGQLGKAGGTDGDDVVKARMASV